MLPTRSLPKSHLLIALCLLPAAAGCSGDDTQEPQVDRQTAQLAVTEVTRRVQVDLLSYRETSAEGGATFDCVSGGTASANGHVDVATQPVSVDVQITVDYDACAMDDGYALDGEIDFSQHVLVPAEQSVFRVETILVGESTISRPNGESFTCDFDLNVVVDGSGALVSAAGSACGYPASAFDVVITPHW